VKNYTILVFALFCVDRKIIIYIYFFLISVCLSLLIDVVYN
jgi:hypothetical protein